MSHATLVYPHQLFKNSPALALDRVVYIVEDSLLLTHNPIHIQKLIFHKLSLDAYESYLIGAGFRVERLSIKDYPRTKDIFTYLKKEGVTDIHVTDTTDNYLEAALRNSGLNRVWYESPMFLLDKAEAENLYLSSKKFMATFYKKMRQKTNILVEADGTPAGGAWSYDSSNRKRLPRNILLPADLKQIEALGYPAAVTWAQSLKAETYGDIGLYFPTTHLSAEKWLSDFMIERLNLFGPYEDAIDTKHTRLFHSGISPLLNCGLLTPSDVVAAVLEYTNAHQVPLASVEGFIRQVIGWREFIRASYEVDGTTMRTSNFWQHKRILPKNFWTASCGIPPVDDTINKALKYGYTHHIERLMIIGNFMLLTETDPNHVYKWFMSMYIDAYDWVMVPNVYGMSQFADGGIFATKPYISGGNYIKKMSNYTSSDWEEIWTALYWNFIFTNQKFFLSNHRLSMMPRLFEKMNQQKQAHYIQLTKDYLGED